MQRHDAPRLAAHRRAGTGGAVAAGGACGCRSCRPRKARGASRSFGRAKSIILIHLYGSPSQLEWVDCKPDAPVEIRGEFGVIPSSLPGCDVCELFPNMAKVMDRTTVLRSLTHPYPIHGVAYALTGVPAIDVAMELAPHDPRHWPYFGSVVEYVEQPTRARRARQPSPPSPATSPCRSASARSGSAKCQRAGPYAAFLGSQYDPLWTDFRGTATKGITKTLRDMTYTDHDPYVGVADGSLLRRAQRVAAAAGADARPARHAASRCWRSSISALPSLVASSPGRALTKHQEAALSLLESPKLAAALDLRARAGRNARAVRPDAVRPVVPGRPAAGRSGQQSRQRLLGRVRPGRQRLGHALEPLPADEGGAGPRLRSSAGTA